MADAPLDRDYVVGGEPAPATCALCGKDVPLGAYGLVRISKGYYRAECYSCRPARDAQPARLSAAGGAP